ncbi:acylphosphatase [Hippea maritima]|uniref:acylphosphatase n=1 Tax=Hippea maritima (strain ATCC 700847 / DSM 10411 / MH2) TaxID=760142 RepID=F2LUG5_HIPMA|nr:acylphosphatase [Hippea maritima]AEA33491.1 Acylphosphatase [Hippea maritima DSM 10411]
MPCKRLRITGVVQGVGYRAWAKRLAGMLGVSGYVKNMPDGSVEMVVCADDKIINVMINAAKKGPAASVVKDVEVFDTNYKLENKEFKIWV